MCRSSTPGLGSARSVSPDPTSPERVSSRRLRGMLGSHAEEPDVGQP